MTVGVFADIVTQMRVAQRAYFRTRGAKELARARDLERMVDDALSKRAESKRGTQFTLFGANK